MRLTTLFAVLAVFLSTTLHAADAGPVKQKTDKERYVEILAAVRKKGLVTADRIDWARTYVGKRLEALEDPNEPADLHKWVGEKVERLTSFCAPENNNRGGEWYAMARSHCAELKGKYGVDFAAKDAKSKKDENFEKLFAAYKAERVEGYEAALRLFDEAPVSFDGYHIEPPARKGHYETYSPDGWHIEHYFVPDSVEEYSPDGWHIEYH